MHERLAELEQQHAGSSRSRKEKKQLAYCTEEEAGVVAVGAVEVVVASCCLDCTHVGQGSMHHQSSPGYRRNLDSDMGPL